MSNLTGEKIEKENSADNDSDERKSPSIHHHLESESTVSDMNINLDGTNDDESVLNSQCNPAGSESKNTDSLKCSAYSSDSSSSELANSLQSSNNMQQSQDKNKGYWWDSPECPSNQDSNNIHTEPNKRFKILKRVEASDWWNSNKCSESDSVTPSDGKNCADTPTWWMLPNEQRNPPLHPIQITPNETVNSCENKNKTPLPLPSHTNVLTKSNVSMPKYENSDRSGKMSSGCEKGALPKVSVRPVENYGTMNNFCNNGNNSKYQGDRPSYNQNEMTKNTHDMLGLKTGSSDSSVIIDHDSHDSSCNSQTIHYNSQNTSTLYGSRNCVNQGDFSVKQHPHNRTTAVNGRIRHRSGSWTGVNESDEDVRQLGRNDMDNFSNNSQSLDDSHIFTSQGRHHMNTYQQSFNSFSSENTVPHCNEFLNEESIKRRLKFFFMNPIEKYRARKKCPWKLLVQIIKIIICTVQLCMFAIQRYNHVSYLWDTKVSLSHLFIQGWDATREVVSYPPSTGPLAVYDIQQFYDFIDFSVNSFAHIEETAVGAYKYQIDDEKVNMPEFCVTSYKAGPYNPDKSKKKLGKSILTECFKIPTTIFNSTEPFSLKKFLASKNRKINFDLLLESSYSFNLQTIKMKSEYPFDTPECFQLESLIYFDNNDHDGQMLIDLDIVAKVLDCQENITKSEDSKPDVNPSRTIVNVLTILVCSLSFVLCFRALYRAQILRSAVNSCFLHRFNRELNRWESFEFVNLWYILICINDSFIIVGTIIKISLETQDYEGYLDKWNSCSLLLGTGNLLIWFGCLRYLGFFKTYNVLILTIKHCIPNITRYSICTLMVFAGYSFCGWLVLGPYHIKFRSLSTTSECLFSLINGDDMFATFSSTIGKDFIVWWFSRIYLYTFISLFIYVILSLVIAIITDAYYTLQKYYTDGFPETDLMRFAAESKANPSNGDFHDMDDRCNELVKYLCCCCRSNRCRQTSSGYESIPSDE